MVSFYEYLSTQMALAAMQVEENVMKIGEVERNCKLGSSKRGDGFEFYGIIDKNKKYMKEHEAELQKIVEELLRDETASGLAQYQHIVRKGAKAIRKAVERRNHSSENQAITRLYKCYPGVVENAVMNVFECDEDRARRILDPYGWAAENSYKNNYKKELIRYRADDGNFMRTKSEVLWGNALYRYGIPYAYEAELVAGGRVLYPDFMPIKPDGNLLIIEHAGLMDDTEYRSRFYKKLDAYRSVGFEVNRNLIITTEEDMMADGRLEELLLRYYFI